MSQETSVSCSLEVDMVVHATNLSLRQDKSGGNCEWCSMPIIPAAGPGGPWVQSQHQTRRVRRVVSLRPHGLHSKSLSWWKENKDNIDCVKKKI